MESSGDKSRDYNKETKKETKNTSPAAMRLNIAPAVPRKIVPMTVPVPTYSPAYAKGGMVRGCGMAVKGRGKVKVY